jgi:hypothetical protein
VHRRDCVRGGYEPRRGIIPIVITIVVRISVGKFFRQVVVTVIIVNSIGVFRRSAVGFGICRGIRD